LDLDIGRGVESVDVSEPRNAQSATLRGLEVGWQQTLTFLPQPFDGLGFADQYWMGRRTYDANVTWRYNNALTMHGGPRSPTTTARAPGELYGITRQGRQIVRMRIPIKIEK
jgi:hypothetical protein